jgi:hypothetical protein
MPLQYKKLITTLVFFVIIVLFLSQIIPSFHLAQASSGSSIFPRSTPKYDVSGNTTLYLPLVQKPIPILPVLNIPFFEGEEINYHQAAVTWFGQVRGNENYADVRVGYNSSEIYVNVTVFDRFLWFDTSPDIYNLTEWDAVSLYLDLSGNNGTGLRTSMYRFTRQTEWLDDPLERQIAYQANSTGWEPSPLTFSTNYFWRGNAPNDAIEDRGYVLTFHIPFASLGLQGAPSIGTKWGAAVVVHDRDDASGSTLSEKYWPNDFVSSRSGTWGQFSFGLPDFVPPPASNPQSYTFREGVNGYHMIDGVVGGNTTCGRGLDFWWQWGDSTHPQIRYMNAQNQRDVADWPCFSKFYITFPLGSLPFNKTVVSAILTLYQLGQATGLPTDPPEALNSLIQASVIYQDWNEATLTWNNAPMPTENVSQTWVESLADGEMGIPYEWDLGRAVSMVYADHQHLRLVFYSADYYSGHGKYFFSSDEDWDIVRPSLTIVLGDP